MLIDCCPISTPSATFTHKSLQDSVSQSLSKYKTLMSDRPNFQAYRTLTDTDELSPKVDFKTFSHSQGVAHTEAQNQAMAMSLRCPKDNTAAPFLQGDAIRMDCIRVIPSGYTAKMTCQSLYGFGHRGLWRCWLNLSFWPKVLTCSKEEVCWTNSRSTAKLGETANKEPCLWKWKPSRCDSIPSPSTLANLPECNVSLFAFIELKGHKGKGCRQASLRSWSEKGLGSHRGQKWLKLKFFLKKKKSE